MPKINKKETTKESNEASTPSIDITMGNQLKSPPKEKESLVGKVISLNLAKQTTFGVGNIWLTDRNYWAKIPANLTRLDYEIIARSLRAGNIVLGKTYMPPIEKDYKVRSQYWEAVKRVQGNQVTQEVKNMFSSLVNKKSDGGWTPYEIANYCLAQEKTTRARPTMISLLDQVKAMYTGPQELFQEPDDSVEGIKTNPIEEHVDPLAGLVLDQPE